MNSDAIIRRYAEPDLAGIEQLVTAVVLECYGHLLRDFHFDRSENWAASWVVARISAGGAEIIGVMLTGDDWLDDLWIARSYRGGGLGRDLLGIAENEIFARGHAQARLRVVAENTRALRFYARQGWQADRRYAHERNGFDMIDMIKPAPAR
jgi:ribosomal protein S18 acetylase RimI-like enzyme